MNISEEIIENKIKEIINNSNNLKDFLYSHPKYIHSNEYYSQSIKEYKSLSEILSLFHEEFFNYSKKNLSIINFISRRIKQNKNQKFFNLNNFLNILKKNSKLINKFLNEHSEEKRKKIFEFWNDEEILGLYHETIFNYIKNNIRNCNIILNIIN